MYLPIFNNAYRNGALFKPEVLVLEVRAVREGNRQPVTWVAVQRRETYTFEPGSKEVATAKFHLAFQAFEWDGPRGSASHGEFCGYYDRNEGSLSLSSSGPWRGGVYVPPMLQGLRLGTYLMNEVVVWASQWPTAQVVPIELAEGDGYPENRTRRNQFYEQFGLVFNYADADHKAGWSRPITVGELHAVVSWQDNITEYRLIDFLQDRLTREWFLSSDLEAREKAIRELSASKEWADHRPISAMLIRLWRFNLGKLMLLAISVGAGWKLWRLFW